MKPTISALKNWGSGVYMLRLVKTNITKDQDYEQKLPSQVFLMDFSTLKLEGGDLQHKLS